MVQKNRKREEKKRSKNQRNLRTRKSRFRRTNAPSPWQGIHKSEHHVIYRLRYTKNAITTTTKNLNSQLRMIRKFSENIWHLYMCTEIFSLVYPLNSWSAKDEKPLKNREQTEKKYDL